MKSLADCDWALWRDPAPVRRAWRWLAFSAVLFLAAACYYAYTVFELRNVRAQAAQQAAEAARLAALQPPPGTVVMTVEEWARVHKSLEAIRFDWNAEFKRIAEAFPPGARATRWTFTPFAEDSTLGVVTARVANPDLPAEIETRLNALPSRCTWRLVLIERVKESAPSPEWDARFECVVPVSEQLPVNK
jgi:hypothetical protein